MMFGNRLSASLILASLVLSPALAFADGKVTTFTYAYSGEKAATFEANEASQIDLSKFPKAGHLEFKRYGRDLTIYDLVFSVKNGCDVLTTTITDKSEQFAGEEARKPYVMESKLCSGETLYTAEGKLVYVGKSDVAVPEYYEKDVDSYHVLAMFKGARSGKIYYVDMDRASAIIKNSREFRAGRAISVGGYYEAQFIHDFVIAKIGFAKAHSSAKQALKRTCTEIFGGSITGGINYEDGSYNAGFMTAHASATGVCSAE